MVDLAAPNPLNYTFGAHAVFIGAGAGVNLGNVVKATVSFGSSSVSHFSALLGKEVEDPSLLELHDMSLSIELDEPNKANLSRWFLADASLNVGMKPNQIARLVLQGIAVVGNVFSWDIPRCSIRPSGDFGYGAEDWSTFTLEGKVLYNAATPANPYGTLTHTGV